MFNGNTRRHCDGKPSMPHALNKHFPEESSANPDIQDNCCLLSEALISVHMLPEVDSLPWGREEGCLLELGTVLYLLPTNQFAHCFWHNVGICLLSYWKKYFKSTVS